MRKSSADSPAAQFLEMVETLRLRDLQFLCEIANTKSLSQAAGRFDMTQPSASRLLGQLEKSFHAHLFDRDRQKGMTPTTAGEMAIARGRAILADMQSLAGELVSLRTGARGQLRLGVIPFLSSTLLRDLIAELVSAPSELSVSVVEAASTELVAKLRDESLDVAIARCSLKGSTEDLKQIPLFQQRPCLVVHRDNTLLVGGRIAASQLQGCSWILPPRHTPTRTAFDEVFTKEKLLPPQATVETASFKVILSLVSAVPGMVALVPAEVGSDLSRLGAVKTLAFPFTFDLPPIGFICLKRHVTRPVNAKVRAVVQGLAARGMPLD